MKTFFSLALLALAQASLLSSSSADLTSEFLSWKASPAGQVAYENGYVPDAVASASTAAGRVLKADADAPPMAEELERFQNAKDTIARLQLEQPRAVFSLSTPFALLTAEEFKKYVGSDEDFSAQRKLLEKRVADDSFRNVSSASYISKGAVRHRILKDQADLADVDWVSTGCVNPPIDQGKCQASWALSAVGAMESLHCLKTGSLLKLSSQEVISCATPSGQNQCSKGITVRAFDYLGRLNNGGLCQDSAYPYASSDGVAPGCRKTNDASFSCNKVDISGFFYDVQNYRDHTQLESVVYQQPVATLINTGTQTFQYLSGGVIMGNEANCPSKQVDSSVLIVGYGTLDGVKYWKIRNNWSTYWGNGGYAYIERGYQGSENGACGVETLGYYPVRAAAGSGPVLQRCSAMRSRVEVIGTTLKSVPAVKPQDCCDKCRSLSGCEGYVWHYETDTCELKTKVTGEVANAAGARPTYSGTIMLRDARIQQGSIFNDLDFAGNDIFSARATTAEDCMDLCNEYPSCHAFTWSQYLNGMCYMKSKRTLQSIPASKNADGSSSIRSGTSYKCSPLQSDTDLVGTDISGVLAPAVNDCCGICRATANCGAFTWSNYNGGTCWLKQAGATTKVGAGVTSAFLG